MMMKRLAVLEGGAALWAAAMLPALPASAEAAFAPKPESWRTFELTTRIEVANPQGATRIWVPLPGIEAAVVDLSGRFLYVANVSALNPQPKISAESRKECDPVCKALTSEA